MSIEKFIASAKDNQKILISKKSTILFTNNSGDIFHIPSTDILKFLIYFSENYDNIYSAWESAPERKESIALYEEKSYRKIYTSVENTEGLRSISTLGKSQTRSLTLALSKIICFLSNLEHAAYLNDTLLNPHHIKVAISNWNKIYKQDSGESKAKLKESKRTQLQQLPKPFLLLAGISGTGKSRFVRQQARSDLSNYQLVAVRPDWHEPSDLLGYISRLTGTTEYVSTPLLGFIVRAWQELLDNGCTLDGERLTGTRDQLDTVLPFWLCLDEMNLAPVEQYFADYLALIETREWYWPDADSFEYSCNPLLVADTLKELGKEAQQNLATKLGLEAESELWQHFIEHGIAIPPNLIVAGTVNMDETTHGFSRKVIDRAMTFDFGEFFPNRFDDFLDGKIKHVPLSFPVHSSAKSAFGLNVTEENAGAGKAPVPENVKKSIEFLDQVNTVLRGTPFELAYRALNELLLAVHCHTPNNDIDLQAVWDDFLMQKVLPRIEGDADKLQQNAQDNLLTRLQQVLETRLGEIWDKDRRRMDFYRVQNDQPMQIPCRSHHKIRWMLDRLESSGFTSFWP